MADELPSRPDSAPDASKRDNKQLMTGMAMGIGSAALVAALLYANRSRRSDKGGSGSSSS